MPIFDSKAAVLVAGLGDHLGLREASAEERSAFEAKLTTSPDRPDEFW